MQLKCMPQEQIVKRYPRLLEMLQWAFDLELDEAAELLSKHKQGLTASFVYGYSAYNSYTAINATFSAREYIRAYIELEKSCDKPAITILQPLTK